MDFDFIYILLNLSLLLIFFFAGKNISSGKSFRKNALLAVMSFSFVQGLRYNRGNDYVHYQEVFYKIDPRHHDNFIFDRFNDLLKLLGINEYSCFIVYALIFSLCAVFFLRSIGICYAKWSMPLFIIGYLVFNEYFIRQAFSYSFVFAFLSCLFSISVNRFKDLILNNTKVKFLLLYFFLSVSIHSANILPLATFSFFFIFYRDPFPAYLTIPVYILCTYIVSKTFDFSYLNSILSFMADANDIAANYVGDSDKWFSEEGKDSVYTRNPLIQLFEVLGVSSYCYLFPKTVEKYGDNNAIFTTLFNVSIIGFVIKTTFIELELLNRVGSVYLLVWCIVLSYVLYNKPKNSKGLQKIAYWGLLWFAYGYIRYLFFPKTDFIWNI